MNGRRLQGYRKMVVFAGCVGSLLAGLALMRGDVNAVGLYTPFVAGVVGIGGWFFKANVDTHKVKPGEGA